jgi:hypothetical protein
MNSRGDESRNEGSAECSTGDARKPKTARTPGRNAGGGTLGSRGTGERMAGRDSGSTLRTSSTTQGGAGEPAEKTGSAQPPPGNTSGKTRRRACVLCGRMFAPTPQNSSTRKYCRVCRPTSPKEPARAVSPDRRGKSASGARLCPRCGQPVPNNRKTWGWLCEGCERPTQPASRARGRRARSNSVRAVLSGLPSLGKRR